MTNLFGVQAAGLADRQNGRDETERVSVCRRLPSKVDTCNIGDRKDRH